MFIPTVNNGQGKKKNIFLIDFSLEFLRSIYSELWEDFSNDNACEREE